MKKPDLDIFKPRIILLTAAVSLFLFSCNEGMFNFSDSTGNISISISADSTDTRLERVVFELHNDNTGFDLSREAEFYEYDGVQDADSYISRANTGSWSMDTAVFDFDNNLISERQDYFELELGQTVIIDIEYSSSGGLTSVFEKPAGSEPDSLIRIDSMDTLISGFHYEGLTLAETSFASIMIAQGSGFNSGLSVVRAEYPDGGFVEYDGGWARAVGNIDVELDDSSVAVSRSGYYSSGAYTLTLRDINDVETSISDDCYPGFPAENGLAIFSGTAYGGGDITPAMWEQNGSGAAGSYIIYIVSATDGSLVAGTYPDVYEPYFYDSSIDTFVLNTAGAAGFGDSYIVIATVNEFISTTEIVDAINNVFNNTGNYPDLSPQKLPGWLYITFGGDRVSYVSLSVAGYNFP